MSTRLVALVWTLAAIPFAVAAEEENPYKKSKVGDFATFKMTTKLAGLNIEGTITQTVTAKDDKEVTIQTSGKVNNMEIQRQEQKIDLTKPFDVTKAGNLPVGGQINVEKLKEGKEKVKLGGKEYEADWATYKMSTKSMGMEFEAGMKVWRSGEVNLPMIKMELTADVVGNKTEMVMELIETGFKEPEKKEPEKKEPEKKEPEKVKDK